MTLLRWQSLESWLEAELTDEENQALARSIFNTDQPQLIAECLHTVCRTQLETDIDACGFSYFSVGATFVLRLKTDEQVVIKAHGTDKGIVALHASVQVQNRLAKDGFSCPRIMAMPLVRDRTLFTIQEYIEAVDRVDGFDPSIRLAMARGLADLIRRTTEYGIVPELPLWMPWLANRSILWAIPHNVLFDFEKTASGAEWIDAIAQEAKHVLLHTEGNWVMGHSDWSLQNMAFQNGTLVGVFDWDSLRIGYEPFFVGGAARCFAHDWRYGAPARSITIDEVIAFVQEYEAAREVPFTAEERRSIGAAVVYTAAYGARCAHPGNNPETEHSHRTKLQLKAFAQYFLPHSF